MKSFFIGKYEIKLPIIQGGMGVGVSLNGLASAVANEGESGLFQRQDWGYFIPNTEEVTPKSAFTDSVRRSAKPAKKRTA